MKWSGLQYVTGGLTLAAFLALLISRTMLALARRESVLVESAPASDRAKLLEQISERYRLNTSGLPPEAIYKLVHLQLTNREHRFRNVLRYSPGALAILLVSAMILVFLNRSMTSPRPPEITLMDPSDDKSVNEGNIRIPVLFRSDYADLLHYILVTPKDGTIWVNGPITLDASGLGRGQVQLGENDEGRNERFRIEVIATHEEMREVKLPARHAQFEHSRSVYVTRGAAR